MNQKLQDLMYHSGLTSQGCWDEMDEYDKQAIEKFAELIVQEAAAFVSGAAEVYNQAEQDACVRASRGLKKYFGIEE